MAAIPFDSANPAGTQTGPSAIDSMRNNLKALRDSILMGQANGYLFSQSSSSTGSPTTTVDQPAYWFWKNGATWLRATLTWGAGAGTNGNPTNIVWDMSINTGTDYTTSPGGNLYTQTLTWDSTTGALTATTGAGGVGSWLMGLLGKYKVFKVAYDAHVASSSAHGVGTMAAQNSSAIAVTGGNIDGVPIGSTTPAVARFTRATEGVNATQVPGAGGSFALDWSNGCSRVTTPSGNTCTAFNNVAAVGVATHLVYVSVFNSVTWPAALPSGNWGAAGKPSIATAAWVSLWTTDGGTTVYGSIAWK